MASALAQTIPASLATEVRATESVLQTFPQVYTAVINAADILQDHGFASDAQACLSRIQELATVESQFASQVGAFRQMQSSYAPNEEGEHETNFAAQYDQAYAQLMTQRPRPEQHERYKELEGKLKRAGPTQGANGGNDDEDIEMEDNNDLAPNLTCPFCCKPLLELTEPVEDQKGFVYEKAIVEDHIKKSGQRRVPAPQAGATHQVGLADLRPARKVIRAQKRARANPTQAEDEDDDDVLDVE